MLQTEIETLYQKIINRTKSVVNKVKETLEKEINNLKILKDETQPYFDAVKVLQQSGQEIKVEEITEEKVKELLVHVEKKLLRETEEQEVRDAYQQILMVLGYKFENETIQQTYEKVKNLITRSYEVTNFSYELFVSKLNSIDSILANQILCDLKKKLKEGNENNKNLDSEIKELQTLKNIATQRARDIRMLVEELSQDEYKKVGPALSKFYNKLARFNSSEGINIVQENGGISLVDLIDFLLSQSLSTVRDSQISVFMLAHFFAGINARNDCEKMKVYFIDDLTACMDDVNMLAFMDLLKYQMTSKATMEQLFFITCDERISKLLKYKLSGRGIELCELLEADFA